MAATAAAQQAHERALQERLEEFKAEKASYEARLAALQSESDARAASLNERIEGLQACAL